jgi:hypothetical protein
MRFVSTYAKSREQLNNIAYIVLVLQAGCNGIAFAQGHDEQLIWKHQEGRSAEWVAECESSTTMKDAN